MDKRDKRSSFLNKVGDTLRIGKEKMKIKVVHSNTKICVEENSNNGGGFGEDMDTQNLTDTEVDAKFEEMLDDMNLSEEKKEPLRKKDANQKRAMLAMHVKGSSQKSLGGSSSTPHDFVKELRNPDLKGEKRFKVLESLKVSLTSNPVSWVQEFGSPGLNALLRNLTYCCAYCCDRKSEQKSTNACVRCLKAFMNNLFGLREIITHEEALTILFWTVDPSDPPTMLEAVRLLAAVCLVPPDGHEKALEGITACGEIRGQERFDPIIMGLGMRDNLPLQVACIQLVNAIVSTPDDLDFRMHLRNEFLRTGLIDLIGSLESQKGEELKTQLQIFHSHKEEDSEEFSHRYDNIRLELEYTQECFKLLLQTVTNTDSEPFFLSILQHLLSIRDDLYARPQYYKLIEECVTQIVLHRSGVDPDFRHTRRFEIDVEPLLSNLTEKSKLEESQDNNLITTKKLEEALMAKQESEARASTLEEKVKQYEQEIAQMKEKIQHGIGAVVSSSISSDGKGRAPPPPGGIPPPPPPPPGSGGPPPPPPPPPPPGCGPPPPPPPPPGCGPPPPPPPPPGGGPPPPPGSCPAPPPPGGFSPGSGNQLPFGIQPKKKYSLHTQTKRANWNKVNMKLLNEDSFWIKANEEKFESEDLFRGIEDNFCVKVKAAPENTENKSSSEEKKPTKKAKELKVLDGKAAQNLSILLGSIKVPYPEIKRRILEVDEDHLTQNLLEQLLKYMPEPEQMNQLAALKDQYHDLAEPEQFAVTLSEVKRITPKLSSILFKMKFSEIVSDIKPGLVAVIEACDQLKSSNKFAKILQLILLIGNYMNSGSRNAQTVGFEINFLSKLKNTKTQDGNMTLLHFLAKIVEEKYPDLFGFQEELSYVDKAAKASDEILQKNLKQFEKSLNQLDVDLKNASKNKTEDKFSDKMNFISVAREQYNVLNTMYKKMVSLYKNIAKYYSFDPSKYTQEEFFGDIKAFKDGFMQAMKDNAKMRETKEKIRRAKEAKEKKEREKQEKLLRKKKLVDMTTDNDQEGVMDNLLEALKTGSAFNMNRDKRDCNKRRAPRAAGAERRAQLVSTRSRQDLLDSSSREYSVKESGDSKEVSHETPKSTRRRNNPFPNTEGVDDVEELLSRLKAL